MRGLVRKVHGENATLCLEMPKAGKVFVAEIAELDTLHFVLGAPHAISITNNLGRQFLQTVLYL